MPVTTAEVLAAVPRGIILHWYATSGAVPTGWAICDGSNGTPDLRQRFVMGVSDMADVGQGNGGRNVDSIRDNPDWHTHPHSLTEDQIPAHAHRQDVRRHQGPATSPIGDEYGPGGPTGNENNWNWSGSPTGTAGGGQAHYHGLPDHDNRPLHYRLLMIMKL